ncbi:hypothetical protein ES705_13778 [subsurface metagenome]
MLINILWKEAEEEKEKSNTWKKVYNWLNRDNLGNIPLVDNKIFFFELNPSSVMPNYVYHFLVKWGEQKGYKYLYNL